MVNPLAHLKGTEIKMVEVDGKEFKCFVADIHPKIGITIKDIETQEDWICIDLSDERERVLTGTKENHFDYFVKCVKKGIWHQKEMRNTFPYKSGYTSESGSSDACAFE